MRFWVGITDGAWFETLHRLRPEEVNFWQPSDRPPRTMEPGWPFLFKLHSPRNYIGGGGFFVRFTVLPCFLAWDAFGEKDGAASLAELVAYSGPDRSPIPAQTDHPFRWQPDHFSGPDRNDDRQQRQER